MPGTPPEDQQPRPIASYEAEFWAFLEYPLFWVPVVAVTVLGIIALTVVMVVR
jgi:hypothetical protein